MDTQKLIARLRERAATQDACGCWSLDRAVADELERLVAALEKEYAAGYTEGHKVGYGFGRLDAQLVNKYK